MKNKGFTLIELTITIGILAILSTLVFAIVNPLDQIRKANDARRKDDLNQIQKSLEQYYQDNGQYPQSSSSYQIENPALTPVPWGGSWSPYMNSLPKDPDSGRTYIYYTTNQQSYYLYASLERGGKDPQACNISGTACTNVPNNKAVTCSATGSTTTDYCNYGVSSPNTSP